MFSNKVVPGLSRFGASLLTLTFSCCIALAGNLEEWNVNNLEPECHGISNATFFGFCLGNNTGVAVGGGAILSTEDGINWELANTSGSLGDAQTTLRDVTFGNGLFVAVGYQFVPYSVDALVLTSTDAVEWAEQRFPSNTLYSVTFGKSMFVGVGARGQVLTSTDGNVWASQANPTTNDLLPRCVRKWHFRSSRTLYSTHFC